MQIRLLVTSQCGHKVVYNHKKLNKIVLSTVVALTTKLHDMSTMRFPWQHNGLQAIIRVFLLQEVLFAIVVCSVDVSEYGHYTAQAQAQESLLNTGATNTAVFILGR